jgi:hypothetical protein
MPQKAQNCRAFSSVMSSDIIRITMEVTAKELYEKKVLQLPIKERLLLAAMILNDITTAEENIELSDTWTEEDLQDLSAFALSHSENPHEKPRHKP